MPIGPSSKLKGYRIGTEVDYVDLRRLVLWLHQDELAAVTF